MSDKPMLSVELRSFLEGVVKLCAVHGPTYNELRALLDKPCCDHEFESPVLSSMPDYCAKCHADKPVAQHQGEPDL